jgi:PhzF family phenazine biosynthesis protein
LFPSNLLIAWIAAIGTKKWVKMKIWTIDAFTDRPFGGNPAAVMLVEDFFPDSLCFQIAAEMNLSETAFIKHIVDDHFHLRWFKPTIEMDLCGHGTLASAHLLFDQGMVVGDEIHFDTKSGPLFVVKEKDRYRMDFPVSSCGLEIDPTPFQTLFGCEILHAFNAEEQVLVEFAREEDLRHLSVDWNALSKLDYTGVIITVKGHGQYDFLSRYFRLLHGMGEDPVTGAIHCKLAPYWEKKLCKAEFKAFQASKRGGGLTVRIVGERVHLIGQAVTVIEGRFLKKFPC